MNTYCPIISIFQTGFQPSIWTIFPESGSRFYFALTITLLIGVMILMGLFMRIAQQLIAQYRSQQQLDLKMIQTRIAMDLHDDLGANLSSIVMLSEVLQRDSKSSSVEITERLARIASISRESVDALSDIVWSINPEKDRLADLTQRMRRLADDLCAARNLEFSFQTDVSDQTMKLQTETRREVILIFKECINNIAKHSNCTLVKVVFQQQREFLCLRISDNGKGIDAAAVQTGNGLGSLRQRARKLGGRLEIISENGCGTVMSLKLPSHPITSFQNLNSRLN
jgi:signal transduction histidine kinase